MSSTLTPELRRLHDALVDAVCIPPCAHEACLLGRGLLRSILSDATRPYLRVIGGPGDGTSSIRLSTEDLIARVDTVLAGASPEDLYRVRSWVTRGDRFWRASCPLPGHGGDRSAPSLSVDTRTLRWTCWTHCGHGSAVDYVSRVAGGPDHPRGREWCRYARLLLSLLDSGAVDLDEAHARWLESWPRDR